MAVPLGTCHCRRMLNRQRTEQKRSPDGPRPPRRVAEAIARRTARVNFVEANRKRSVDQVDRVEAERLIAAHSLWYHTIDVAPGLTTTGWFDSRHTVNLLPW